MGTFVASIIIVGIGAAFLFIGMGNSPNSGVPNTSTQNPNQSQVSDGNASQVSNESQNIIQNPASKSGAQQKIASSETKDIKVNKASAVSNSTSSKAVKTPASSAGASLQSNSTKSESGLKSFTVEELKKYNGQNGNPAYVAVDGKVYDVTHIKQWMNGIHYGYSAGLDLSNVIDSSPHGRVVLEILTVVGTLGQ